MAVPKGKVSKARRNSRNSSNFKNKAPTLVECPSCHESTKPHTVCSKCGNYKGRKVVEVVKKEKKDKK